jgi:hypothetical protein
MDVRCTSFVPFVLDGTALLLGASLVQDASTDALNKTATHRNGLGM